MKKIKIIWRLIDGKAGHDKQSLALVENLKSQNKCKVFDINVQNLHNPILSIIFKNYNSTKGFAYPDIAIGAGHTTHLHLLAIKRSFDAKIVVIMKPSLPLRFFDLCIAPDHDGLRSGPNIFNTQTALVRFNLHVRKKENVGLFLIGGPSKHYFWNKKLVLQQIRKISKKFKFKKFLLATSRRTPFDFVRSLNTLNIQNMQVYEYSKIEDNWLEKNINKVKKIWVTNDSYSMIIEALASGAHTDILDLKIKKNSKLSKDIDTIKNNIRSRIAIKDEAKRAAKFIKKIWF